MTEEHGQVLAVVTKRVGDYLTAAATSGLTLILEVEDGSPFQEGGGRLSITSATEADPQVSEEIDYFFSGGDVISLVGFLTNSYPIGSRVETVPAQRIRWAQVQLDDDETVPILARVPYAMHAQLPNGQRDEGTLTSEEVTVALVRGQWVVTDVIGVTPRYEGTVRQREEGVVPYWQFRDAVDGWGLIEGVVSRDLPALIGVIDYATSAEVLIGAPLDAGWEDRWVRFNRNASDSRIIVKMDEIELYTGMVSKAVAGVGVPSGQVASGETWDDWFGWLGITKCTNIPGSIAIYSLGPAWINVAAYSVDSTDRRGARFRAEAAATGVQLRAGAYIEGTVP